MLPATPLHPSTTAPPLPSGGGAFHAVHGITCASRGHIGPYAAVEGAEGAAAAASSVAASVGAANAADGARMVARG